MWSAFTRGRSVFFFGFLAFLVLQILSGSALTSTGVKSVHHDVVAPGVHPGYYPGRAGCQYVPGVKGPVMRCGGLAGKGYLHNGYAYKK